jgi:23S rRNA (guanosine2251-2'-O)-methyltransferase
VIGIEQTTSSVSLEEVEVDTGNKYAICLGNEVDGISNEILPYLDLAVEIPQYGTKHSLNVAVCSGITLWHFTKPFHCESS